MTRNVYQKSLEELHNHIIKMGTMVEEAITDSIKALINKDIALALKTKDSDDIIDDQEQLIERMCLNLIARQQPIARDLRNITAALKLITDLERIGDHASDISELTISMIDSTYIKPLIDIPKMAKIAIKMVDMAITSYIEMNEDLALKTCASDDYVDELFDNIKFELIAIAKDNPASINQVVNFLLIAKYLERMADHATNVAEWVSYVITGSHEHLAGTHHKDTLKENPFKEIL
ncbi:MAG: phosphate signaling complex protein PhoU [Clostridia bacterium]|nr:phosphate signaling complex protein PhoU [Clostridia bacterium]